MSDQDGVAVPPEVRETIETRAAWARALVIRSADEREQAMGIVREVKGLIAKIKADCEESVSTTHKAWKAALAFQKKFLEGPETIEAMCKAAVLKWDGEQERAIKAAADALQAIENERTRKQQEALEKKAEKVKSPERAEALREQAAALVPNAVSVAGPAKQAGESTAVIHRARVLDPIAFIKAAVNAGRFEFVTVDERALNDFAKRTKGAVPLTGVEFYQEKQLRVGGR